MPAGNTRMSPATGATPPTQLSESPQKSFEIAPPLQVRGAANAEGESASAAARSRIRQPRVMRGQCARIDLTGATVIWAIAGAAARRYARDMAPVRKLHHTRYRLNDLRFNRATQYILSDGGDFR